MKKAILTLGILFLIIMQLVACQTYSSVSLGLSFEKSVMAKKVNDNWQPVEDYVFSKGDSIGLALINVSGFKKNKDGLNWMDIDVEVKDPKGKVIVNETGLLGESGKMNLDNNIAESPIGSFQASSEIPSGKYNIKVTVRDRIGGGKIEYSRSFTIK